MSIESGGRDVTPTAGTRFSARASKEQPVTLTVTPAQAAAVEPLRSLTFSLEDSTLTATITAATRYDEASWKMIGQWFDQNQIQAEIKSADGKSFQKMCNSTSMQSNATITITGDEAIRKMAVAGFQFLGAGMLREHNSRLIAMSGVPKQTVRE